MNNNIKLALAFTAGASIGTGATYLITKRRLQSFADEQIASVKASMNDKYKDVVFDQPVKTIADLIAEREIPQEKLVPTTEELEEFAGVAEPYEPEVIAADPLLVELSPEELEEIAELTPEQALEIADEIIETESDPNKAKLRALANRYNNRVADEIYGGVNLPESVTDAPEVGAPFTSVRDPESPYVIGLDEFMIDDEAFQKVTFTYYEEDDVLLDERNMPFEEIEANIGHASLHKFGVGSGDKDIVYVRNERIAHDFEINRISGSYREEVLGIKDPNKKVRIGKLTEADE